MTDTERYALIRQWILLGLGTAGIVGWFVWWYATQVLPPLPYFIAFASLFGVHDIVRRSPNGSTVQKDTDGASTGKP